jgi:PTS system mannose-specific IIA component
MIGILLLAPPDLAAGLITVTEHVLGGRPPQLDVVALDYQETPEHLTDRLRQHIARLSQGDGVLILTDLFGATHTNAACRLLERGRVELVSGVSAPLLLRALNHRDLGLSALTDMIVRGAGQCVVCAQGGTQAAEVSR